MKKLIKFGMLAESLGFDVATKGKLVNLISIFDGGSTGYMSVDEAIEYLNCL